MKSIYMGILLVFSLFAVSHAQNTSRHTDSNVTGHVVDANTGEHLPYITIAVKGTTIGTLTDGTGHFFLKNLPEGGLTLVATFTGYKAQEIEIVSKANTTQEVNFELAEQAISTDQVVVSASRNETNRRTSATVVGVMSAKLFETTASSNLTETMSFQPGLRVENNCSNCGTTQLRINGLDGQYSQILIDSRPIFSSLAGVYGLEQLPVSMVERVEVIRGGGSALFGANAIGGVVNIITKEPLRNSAAISNTTNLIGGKSWDVNTSLNASLVSDDYRTGIYLFGMVRDRQGYDRNGDGFTELPKINSETIGFRGYYKLTPYSRLTAEYHHIHEFRRGGNMPDRPPHEADIAEQLDHKVNGGGLRYQHFTPDYRHRINLYTSAQGIDRNSYFGTMQNPDAYGTTGDQTYVAGGQYTYGFDRLWFSPAELTAGAEFSHNGLRDEIPGYFRYLHQNTNVIGGFLQNEWKTERFSVLIGARVDKHNLMNNAVVSPRANLRYSPNEKVGFRLSYSSGYRAPQAYDEDLHVDAAGGEVALIQLDPNLKPEYSHSFSGSVDLYHNFGRWETNLLAEGFYTMLEDVFRLDPLGEDAQGNLIYLRTNADGARIGGVNLEARAGLPGKVDIQAGYTWQRSRYTTPQRWSEDERLPERRTMFRSPDQYGYLTANFNVTRDFRASLFASYTGPMWVQHLAGYIPEDTERKTPHFFDLGVRLSYNFRVSSFIDLEIYAGVKNMFDQFQRDIDRGPLRDAAYIYGPTLPRTWFFGAKFSL